MKAALTFALSLSGVHALDYAEKRFGFGKQRLEGQSHPTVQSSECSGVDEFRYKEAVIDNFASLNDQEYWQSEGQRYWINQEFWGGEGYPIFVFIGGEWVESCRRLTNSQYMYQLAQDHEALMLDVEHRFYGYSYPTNTSSLDNLRYLSAEQGLADLARIIAYVKEQYKTEDSKVITVGGSYTGNLAAWFKAIYPHMSDGSISSSGPLTAKENFYEYMEVVNNAMLYYSGESCVEAFTAAAEAITSLYEQGVGSPGYAQLDRDFATCEPMQSVKDLTILLSDLMGNIQGTAQYNAQSSGTMTVSDICSIMLDSNNGVTEYDRFVYLTALFRDSYGYTCEDVSWENTVSYLSNTTNSADNTARPWTFQTCNEFGYYQTTDSEKQPFYSWKPLGLQFYYDLCFEAFDGWSQPPQIAWMNTVYGALDIAGNNIVFSSGSIDPWSALGVTADIEEMATETETPLFIVGTSHCQDLKAPKSTDPPALTDARKVIAQQVDIFLSDSNQKSSSNDDDSELSTGGMIGIATAVIIVVIGGIIVGVFFAWKRTVKQQNENTAGNSIKSPLI